MNHSKNKTAEWTKRITEQAESGITQSEYCNIHKLKHSTFLYWKKKLTERKEAGRFVELSYPNSNALPTNPRIHFRLGANNRMIIEIENGLNGQFCLEVLQ